MELKTLDFPVKLVDIPHPTIGELSEDRWSTGEQIPGRRAIVRTDTNEVLNIVSSKYPLIKHADMFGAVNTAIEKLGLPVIKVEEKSAYSGGYAKVVWTLDKSFTVEDHGIDDKMNVNITARNSYNYSSVVVLELGTLRQICTNGMTVGKLFAGTRKRHVPSLNVDDLIKQVVGVLEKTDFVASRMNAWNAIEYSRDRFSNWMEAERVPKNIRNRVLDYFTIQPDRAKAGGSPVYSGWEAVNSLTWFATHEVKSRRGDTLMLAEERMIELAQAFTIKELHESAHRRRN